MRTMTLFSAVAAAALLSVAYGANAAEPVTPPSPEGTVQDQNDTAKARPDPVVTTTRTTTTVPTADPAPTESSTMPPPAARPADSAAMPSSSVESMPGATVTTTLVTMAPVADTPENRAKYGGPQSRAGKRTAARGN